MKKLIKICFWFTALLSVVLVGAYFAAPRLINSKIVKDRVENVLSEKIGGDAAFQNISFSILPRPAVMVNSGSITTNTTRAFVKSLRVYPKILPLFTGKLQAAKLQIRSPSIAVDADAIEESGKSDKSEDTISSEIISGWFSFLADQFPALTIVMDNGTIDFMKNNRLYISLKDIDLQVVIPPAGLRGFKADLKSSAVKIIARSDSEERAVTASGLVGHGYHDGDKTALSLSALNFHYPELHLSGQMVIDHDADLIRLALDGIDVDVESTRGAALALFGNNSVTQKIFSIVKGGNVPSISFRSHSGSFADLKKLNNIIINGTMNEGEIFIPKARLSLTSVNGDVVISNGMLEGRSLEAQLDNSYGREGKLTIGLKGKDAPFHLDIMVQADLSELQPILRRLVKHKRFVHEISLIEDITGMASGRMVLGDSLGSIQARVEASAVSLSAQYTRFPYPMRLNTNEFYYDASRVSVKNLDGMAGSSVFSDIGFEVNFKGKPYIDISLGEASVVVDELYPWLAETMNLPSAFGIRSPLSVSHMNAVMDDRETSVWIGNLSLRSGPDFAFDIKWRKGALMVNKLAVRDDTSDASLSLHREESEVDFQFSGKLTKETVNKIVSENKYLNGWVSGDFQTRFDRDNPAQFTANGSLEAEGIVLPAKLKEPVRISSVSLDAEQDTIKIISAEASTGEIPLKLKGDFNTSQDEIAFDIEAVADSIEFEDLKDAFTGVQAGKDDNRFFDFPVKGIIRLTSNSFGWNELTWKPFHADISVSSEKVDVAAKEAALCGIPFPGNISMKPQRISMEFQPTAGNMDLEAASACLFDTEGHLIGSFDLNSRIAADGAAGELMKSLHGDVEFFAREGRIYKGGLLAKVFAVLNVTEILRGELPDLVQEGFAYKAIEATAAIQGGTLNIGRAVIDGSSMTIVGSGTVDLLSTRVDLELLLAPLKTVDYFIKKTPLVRDIFGGSLVSIPVKVTGEYSNPEVTYLPAAGVSSTLSNIMKNSLQTPFKIIEPFLPEGNKAGSER